VTTVAAAGVAEKATVTATTTNKKRSPCGSFFF